MTLISWLIASVLAPAPVLSAARSESFSYSPHSGLQGTTIDVVGSCDLGAFEVSLTLDWTVSFPSGLAEESYSTHMRAPIEVDGSWTAQLPVGDGAPRGPHKIYVVCVYDDDNATQIASGETFEVLGDPSVATTIVAAPSPVEAGGTVRLRGTCGLGPAGGTASLSVQPVSYPAPPVTLRGPDMAVDATGTFRGVFQVPADAPAGAYRLELNCSTDDYSINILHRTETLTIVERGSLPTTTQVTAPADPDPTTPPNLDPELPAPAEPAAPTPAEPDFTG